MAEAVVSGVASATTSTAKATSKIVAAVSDFAAVKAEITRLEKIKAALADTITEAFGDARVLVHRNLEIARLDERSRTTTDDAKLLKDFPEVHAATRKTTTYDVIVNIHR
jgi:hypothetical protein